MDLEIKFFDAKRKNGGVGSVRNRRPHFSSLHDEALAEVCNDALGGFPEFLPLKAFEDLLCLLELLFALNEVASFNEELAIA